MIFGRLLARMLALMVILTTFALSATAQQTFAQNSDVSIGNQTILTDDIANNPIAQDILKKIELTKQWIADLEKQEYEKLKAKEFLEEKRRTALERLNQDLLEWEILWANYTSKAAFERFVDKKPSSVQGVFWDQFEFKEMKVKAGRDALKQVFANGGTLAEAREAYPKAAETKRIELIAANAQFNVNHNLAYYKEQLLFNSTGHYSYTDETQAKLNQYYEDYKTNPAYLQANPTDKFAAGYGETQPDTECREGFLVIYRFQQNDYACVTEATAEMWMRYGIGNIPGGSPLSSDSAKTDVSKSVSERIQEINKQISEIKSKYSLQEIELKAKYDKQYADIEIQAKNDEKKILELYRNNQTMTNKEASKKILEVRHTYNAEKDKVLEEKIEALDSLRVEFEQKTISISNKYDEDPQIQMIWNSELGIYEAVAR